MYKITSLGSDQEKINFNEQKKIVFLGEITSIADLRKKIFQNYKQDKINLIFEERLSGHPFLAAIDS